MPPSLIWVADTATLPLRNKCGFKHRAEAVFAEQPGESGDGAFFIRGQVVMDVPVEVILAEIVVVFGPVADDPVQRVHAEIPRVTKLPA